MLQRAASNACSWWLASHIRTKQSKWLEQSLQDMEERVQSMIKLIEEDGDSFAKRAEMYYKRRPELISCVEESFRAFKALADRYDMVSKELANANKTIGTVFPEQVQFSMDDDEEDDPSTAIPKKLQNPLANPGKVPKVPKAGMEKLKSLINPKPQAKTPVKATQRSQSKSKSKSKSVVKSSGLSKEEALEEINMVQKEILAQQTVKEFVKSSYETGLAKYWEIENQITEMQEKVSKLQDEFDVEVVIEDNEARGLMTEAALKSCRQTLSTLQEKQEKVSKEAKEELKRLESARGLLKSIKREYLKDQDEEGKTRKVGVESRFLEKDRVTLVQESRGSYDDGKGLDLGSMECLTVSELAEKVDELVNKVVTLETAVSTQTALINTLRTEADDLHAQIRKLDKVKAFSPDLRDQVKEMEEKLKRLEDLNKNIETRNSNLQTEFAEARSSLSQLSEKLGNVKPDEDVPDFPSSEDEAKTPWEENKHQKDVENRSDTKKTTEIEKTEEVKDVDVEGDSSKPSVPKEEVKEPVRRLISSRKSIRKEEPKEPVRRLVSVVKKANDHEDDEGWVNTELLVGMEKEDLNWEEILLSGSDAEKALLQEYNKVLQDYKEVKRKLRELEKKERESEFESTVQIKELKETITKKDQEIQALCQQLTLLQEEKGKEDYGTLTSDVSQDRSAKPEPESEEILEVKEDITAEANDVPDENKEDKKLQDEPIGSSVVEEKFREVFDVILDENLDFWLRFSTLFNQVQKFKTEVQDLKDEISKLQDKKEVEGCLTLQLKSEARPHFKHLREIETELALCLEQHASLKEELKNQYNSLCSIQEDITKVLKEGTIDGEVVEFSSHQAARLQGEIQNMKQENSKVRKELQAGINESALLQVEIEKSVRVLSEEFGITSGQPQMQLQQCLTKAKVPLRSFIFGTKPKKKQSFLSFMQAQANRKFPVGRGGHPTAKPLAITHR